MSNHHHTGIYDAEGNYPAFIEHFHKFFAKCQNAFHGRWENFWSSEQTSVVRLVDANDLIDKMTYALTNPVKDGLVEHAHQWPGVSSLTSLSLGKPLVGIRPRYFFRDDGPMPDAAELSFSQPEGFDMPTGAELAEVVLERIRIAEETFAAERRRTGVRVLGRRAVLAQKWSDSPTSREPRRELNPGVAARSKWSRIEALLRNRAFREAYTAAREAFAAGAYDVLFPEGTYWLRRFTHAMCEPRAAPA